MAFGMFSTEITPYIEFTQKAYARINFESTLACHWTAKCCHATSWHHEDVVMRANDEGSAFRCDGAETSFRVKCGTDSMLRHFATLANRVSTHG